MGTSLTENHCQFPNEELLKLMRDPKKNLNGPPEDKDMVSYFLKNRAKGGI